MSEKHCGVNDLKAAIMRFNKRNYGIAEENFLFERPNCIVLHRKTYHPYDKCDFTVDITTAVDITGSAPRIIQCVDDCLTAEERFSSYDDIVDQLDNIPYALFCVPFKETLFFCWLLAEKIKYGIDHGIAFDNTIVKKCDEEFFRGVLHNEN